MTNRQQSDQTTLELAANRLLLRAIVAHLILSDSERAESTIRSLNSAINAVASGVIKVPDMDPTVQSKASDLARQRARAFLSDFSMTPEFDDLRAREQTHDASALAPRYLSRVVSQSG